MERKSKKRKLKKRIIWIFVFVVIGAVVVWVIGNTGNNGDNQSRTVKVERKNIVDKALAVGSIEPLNEISVRSKISGVVGKLFINVGDKVTKGDILIEVRPDPKRDRN
jgi:HlyD family secretion protein